MLLGKWLARLRVARLVAVDALIVPKVAKSAKRASKEMGKSIENEAKPIDNPNEIRLHLGTTAIV